MVGVIVPRTARFVLSDIDGHLEWAALLLIGMNAPSDRGQRVAKKERFGAGGLSSGGEWS
jgi:hypothetical protein